MVNQLYTGHHLDTGDRMTSNIDTIVVIIEFIV